MPIFTAATSTSDSSVESSSPTRYGSTGLAATTASEFGSVSAVT